MPRPKLNRERFPSGRAKPDNADPVVRVRAIIEAARREAPILTTPVGRLHFETGDDGKPYLSAAHVAAADRFLTVRARYDAVMGFPSPNVRSMAYGEARRGYSGFDDERRVLAARKAWDALCGLYERPVGDLLQRVIVCGLEPSWSERAGLRYGLQAIAVHMGLQKPS